MMYIGNSLRKYEKQENDSNNLMVALYYLSTCRTNDKIICINKVTYAMIIITKVTYIT